VRTVVTNSRTRARAGLFEVVESLMFDQRAGIRAQDGSCGMYELSRSIVQGFGECDVGVRGSSAGRRQCAERESVRSEEKEEAEVGGSLRVVRCGAVELAGR
jgi:hypothetical protein